MTDEDHREKPKGSAALHAKNYADYPLPDDSELAALICHLLDEILSLRIRCRSTVNQLRLYTNLPPAPLASDLAEMRITSRCSPTSKSEVPS